MQLQAGKSLSRFLKGNREGYTLHQQPQTLHMVVHDGYTLRYQTSALEPGSTKTFAACRAASAVTEPLSLLPCGAVNTPDGALDAQGTTFLLLNCGPHRSKLEHPSEVCLGLRAGLERPCKPTVSSLCGLFCGVYRRLGDAPIRAVTVQHQLTASLC